MAVVLLSVTGNTPPNGSSRQEDAQVTTVVRLARTNLQARLGIRAEAIALESTRPLIFPCPAPGTCQERQPGYVVRLAVDDLVYEYNARVVGKQRILWREVEVAQLLDGEGKFGQ